MHSHIWYTWIMTLTGNTFDWLSSCDCCCFFPQGSPGVPGTPGAFEVVGPVAVSINMFFKL